MTFFFKNEQVENQSVPFGQGLYHFHQDMLGNVFNREFVRIVSGLFLPVVMFYWIMESPFPGLNEFNRFIDGNLMNPGLQASVPFVGEFADVRMIASS